MSKKIPQEDVHAPRNSLLCPLPECGRPFTPKTEGQKFCEPEHRRLFHILKVKAGTEKMRTEGLKVRLERKGGPVWKRAVVLLKDGLPHTGAEIAAVLGAIYPATVMADVRKRGYVVDSIKSKKTGKWEYTMVYSPEGRVSPISEEDRQKELF